jgi:FixJ family two-component response regulator
MSAPPHPRNNNQSAAGRAFRPSSPVPAGRFTSRNFTAAAGGNATSGQERAELESDTQRVLAELPPHLQEIASRLVNATEAAIARDLGISRRQVRNAVETIRAHFQKAGLTEI